MGPAGRNDHYVPLVYVVNPKPVVSNVDCHIFFFESDIITSDFVYLLETPAAGLQRFPYNPSLTDHRVCQIFGNQLGSILIQSYSIQ